jgi:hypothetical protein
MEQHISTSPTTFLEIAFKAILVLIATFLDEKSQLELAFICKHLFGVFEACLETLTYFLLCNSEYKIEDSMPKRLRFFNSLPHPTLQTEYSVYFLANSLEHYYNRNCRTGWKRKRVNIAICHVDKVNNLKTSSIKAISLKSPFKLSDEMLKCANSISHVLLEFCEGDTDSSISVLEKFPNLVSVWFFRAKFNEEMVKTISQCPLLHSTLLHECKIRYCHLSEMAEICKIKNLQLSKTNQFSSEHLRFLNEKLEHPDKQLKFPNIIILPPQCEELIFEPLRSDIFISQLDLSNCNRLSSL